jgi:hypothetical protein
MLAVHRRTHHHMNPFPGRRSRRRPTRKECPERRCSCARVPVVSRLRLWSQECPATRWSTSIEPVARVVLDRRQNCPDGRPGQHVEVRIARTGRRSCAGTSARPITEPMSGASSSSRSRIVQVVTLTRSGSSAARQSCKSRGEAPRAEGSRMRDVGFIARATPARPQQILIQGNMRGERPRVVPRWAVTRTRPYVGHVLMGER